MKRKFSKQLTKLMAATPANDSLEVIVLLQPPADRGQKGAGEAIGSRPAPEAAKEASESRLGDFLDYVRFLAADGESIQVLDSSWLANSVLMMASARALKTVARREEVALIDVNADVKLVESSSSNSRFS